MAIKKLSKKAIFFTGVALTLLTVAMLGHLLFENISLREKSQIESVRITTMNSFVGDLERDMERSLYIASFRALLGANQYITDNGVFLDNTEERLEELILNGTINGSYTNMTADSYFFEWVSRVDDVADKLSVNVELTNTDIIVTQQSPWDVSITLKVNVKVEDPIQKVKWERNKTITTTISILEFEDPLYTVYSNKQIINTIRKTEYTDFTNGDDTTNLTLHMENSYYVASDSGPSYLQRLEGDTSPASDGMGIESLININQLTFQGMDTNKSIVDYIYWGNINHTAYEINNTNFMLDNQSNHLNEYEVEHLVI